MAAPVVHKADAKALVRMHNPGFRLIGYQFRGLFPILVCVGLLLVLTLALVFLPMHKQAAADPSPVIRAILEAQLFRIELWQASLLALSASLAGIAALLHSRRVAGSLKRLREGLAKLAVGDTEPLTFQHRDEFQELEVPLAGVVSRMEEITRSKLKMLRFLRLNLEGIAQRAESQNLSGQELRESVAVLLRDVDAEIKNLQMRA